MNTFILIFSIAFFYMTFYVVKQLWEKVEEVESRFMEINKILDGIRRRIG